MTEITFNKKEIDKAMERLDSFEEKPLKRKRRQLISGSFIYDEEDVAQAVDRLKEGLKKNSGFEYMNNWELIDEIFGDLK